MANYVGTRGNDRIVGAAEQDFFYDFGIGRDDLTGGLKSDTFYLSVDDLVDTVDGRDGSDTIDYSKADRALRIDLTAGRVTATFHYHDVISYDATVTVTQVQNVENATGSIYDDTIYGNDGKNTLDGNDGADTLFGRGGNDTLLGGDGADRLFGEDQDDKLLGGIGNDYINGGSGIDTVSYADADRGEGVELVLGDHSYELSQVAPHQAAFMDPTFNTLHSIEADTVVAVENAIGTKYGDYIVGGNEANVLDGGAGNGNDWLFGHGGDDTLIGGDGDDWLYGHAGADHLVGGNGFDWAAYDDNGWDWDGVNPGTVVINLANPSLNTWWAAGDTYDSIENIKGSPFNDTITGDGNNNILVDTMGSNTFYGRDGLDRFVGSPNHPDAFYGGNDEDTVDYSWSGATDTIHGINYVTVDLDHPDVNAGAAAGDTFVFVEDVIGTNHADTISGNWENNILIGNDGDDHLEGRGWNDTLLGGDGNDTAIFSGNFADYQFTTVNQLTPDGHLERFLEVHDTHADRDGTDDLYGVEHLQFHNMTVDTASLMDPLFHL